MAVPNTFYITAAGTTGAIGTYTRGADFGGYPSWTNENGWTIRIDSGGPGFKIWKILNTVGQTAYASQSDQFASATWPGEWPADPAADPAIVITAGTFGSNPVPTFTLTPPAPDPYAPWGGFANYQRLRFLEYL